MTDQTTTTAPPWAEQLVAKYRSGVAHAFALHFNVNDYADHTNPVRAYLAGLLASRDIVAFYNRAEGITFPLPAMKERFIQELGLDASPQASLGRLAAMAGPTAESADNTPLPRNPSDAFPLLERMLRLPACKTALVIEYAETLFPDGDVASLSPADREAMVFAQRWARDMAIAGGSESGGIIIMLTRNLTDLHQSLRAAGSGVESITVPLPDYEARLAYINFLVEQRDLALGDELTPERLAMMTAGLSRMNIEDIKLRAEEMGQPVTRRLVLDRKEEIIRSEFADVIEVLEPRFGFDLIGGMEQIKDFFRRSIIDPIRADNLRRVPMGILLPGPAGVGKTAIIEAVARESGVNCIRLKIGGKIASKWQGEGERNLAKALYAIDTLSPVIVIIEEIDQAMQRGGSNENAQEKRIFQMLLEYMSDTGHRGRVIFIGLTNRPDLLDAALKRPGRFDKKVPCLIPDTGEREAIFAVMFRKYDIETYDLDLAAAARHTEGYTGAEIESIVLKAYEVAGDAGREVVQQSDLDHALDAIRPSTADIELMTLLALAEVSDRDLLPPAYRSRLDDRAGLEAELEAKLAKQPGGRGKREF